MRERMAWFVVAVATVAAGCSGSSGDDARQQTDSVVATSTPSASTPSGSAPSESEASAPLTLPTAPPPSVAEPTESDKEATEQTLALLDDEGRLPDETALRVFATIFAPLPGVEPISTPLDSGMVAEEAYVAVVDRYDTLTAQQQVVVDKVRGPRGTVIDLDDSSDGPPRPAHTRQAGADADLRLGRELLVRADRWLQGKLSWRRPADVGVELAVLPTVGADGTRHFDDTTGGDTRGVYTAGPEALQDLLHCEIRLNSDWFTTAAAADSLVVHELFHCYQTLLRRSDDSSPWIREGGAAWVAGEYAGYVPASWWGTWLTMPEVPLAQRKYTGMGFYALAVRLGVDVWAAMKEHVENDDIEVILRELDTDTLAELWGTHLANRAAWGQTWTVTGASAPAFAATGELLTVPLGGDVSISTPTIPIMNQRWLAAVRYVDVQADVVRVTATEDVNGGFAIGSRSYSDIGGADVSICTLPGGCVCPGGVPDGGIDDAGSAQGYLGVGPSGDGARVIFRGMTLDQFCDPCAAGGVMRAGGAVIRQAGGVCAPPSTPVPAGVDQCVVGSWSSTRWFGTGAAADAFGAGGKGFKVVFGADNSFSGDFTPMTPVINRTTGPDHGEKIEISIKFSGAFRGTWGVGADGRFAGSTPDNGRIRVVGKVKVAGQEFEAINKSLAELAALAGGAGGSSAGVYSVSSCTADTLILETVFNGGTSGIELSRVS